MPETRRTTLALDADAAALLDALALAAQEGRGVECVDPRGGRRPSGCHCKRAVRRGVGPPDCPRSPRRAPGKRARAYNPQGGTHMKSPSPTWQNDLVDGCWSNLPPWLDYLYGGVWMILLDRIRYTRFQIRGWMAGRLFRVWLRLVTHL